MAAHRGRKHGRQQGRDDAVDPRHAGAHGDEREHVEIARLERRPAALEERPAGPQHDGRREQRAASSSMSAGRAIDGGSMRWPPISSANTGTVSAKPIQNRRVMSTSSGLGPASADGELRLERHAADRARARARSAGSRDASGRCRSCLPAQAAAYPRLGLQIVRGIGRELLPASGRAEVVRAPVMCVAMLGGMRVDGHAAHRVLGSMLRMLVRTVFSKGRMGVGLVCCHDDRSLLCVYPWGV